MSRENRREIQDLICKLSDETFSAEDSARLNELLADDPQAQDDYLNHFMIDALLEREFNLSVSPSASATSYTTLNSASADSPDTKADTASSTIQPGRLPEIFNVTGNWMPPRIRACFQQPSRLILASVIFMSVCMGVLFWERSEQMTAQNPQGLSLLNASFESDFQPDFGSGSWFGGKAESVSKWVNVTPADGQRMLRFLEPFTESGDACKVYQLIDWRPIAQKHGHETLVEASAFFNSLNEEFDKSDYAFEVKVYAFSEPPLSNQEDWGSYLRSNRLASSERRVLADIDSQSWQRLSARLHVPAETQFLVVQLSVIGDKLDGGRRFPGLFADNAEVIVMNAF